MKHILITGASSGIGEALAIYYAQTVPGIILSLCGRNKKRMEFVANQCNKLGATTKHKIINVTNKKAIREWVLSCDKDHPLDLVIANAGIGLTTTGYNDYEETFDVNINGVIHTIHPILPLMEQRGYGQIALVSSLAGYTGLPSAPAYSASKNFVRAYGEALRGKLAPKGIQINVICPGFVRSRITDKNKFPMPGFMEADKAAQIIARGLEKNKGRIAFPWFMVLGIKLLSILPYPWYEKFITRLPDKS